MEMAKSGRNKLATAEDRRGGAIAGGSRRWENLSNDILVVIFSRIGVAELIGSVPYVCSSWWHAARDPFCWRNLDFRSWDAISRRLGCRHEDEVDFADLLEFVITRSEEFIDSFHFPEFADEIDLEYLANRCPELQYFSMKNPNVHMAVFCEAMGKLKHLKGMAVHESLICHQVLQHVNECCGNFAELKVFSDAMHRETASAICEGLPRLRKLELTDCMLSRDAILALLDGLKEIEVLDISGHPLFGVTSEVIEKASHLKVFRWDSTHDLGEFEYCSHCDEDFFDQRPCHCVLEKKVMEWLVNHP